MKVDLHFNELYKLEDKIELLSNDPEIIKRGLYEGAGILADKIKSNLAGVLSGNSTGDLMEAFGISKMEVGVGSVNVRLGFDGYDRRGVPNPVKARALESGTSRQKKRPFLRPAINETKEAVQRAVIEEMQKQVDEKLNS